METEKCKPNDLMGLSCLDIE